MSTKKQSKQLVQRKRVGNPSDSVSQSKFCACFGYLNFNQCFQDCIMKCNWIKLCCNCSRCLAGTCQCCAEIGMLKCLAAIGCSQETIANNCKKDSAIFIMIFNGLPISVGAAVALYLASAEMSEFGDQMDAADAAGEDYTCLQTGSSSGDYAQNFKDIFMLNFYVYLVLVIGCLFSIASGPVVVLRWVALPYQAIIGMPAHIAAVLLVYLQSQESVPTSCAGGTEVPELVLEHYDFIKTKSENQWMWALIYTVLVFFACRQGRLRDNVSMKKQYENRQLFHMDTAKRNQEAIKQKREKYFSKTALEVQKLGFKTGKKNQDDDTASP